MSRPSKSQLLEYLLDKRVNSTLVQVVEAVLIEQPEEPISFMVQHLLNAYPNETASVRASFLAASAAAEEAEVEAKTEQSVTTRSRSNSSSSNTSSGSSGSDLVLSISSGSTSTHTQDGGGGGVEVFTATSPDSVEDKTDEAEEEGDLDKHDEASSGGNTIAMTIEAMSSEEQEEKKEEEKKEAEKKEEEKGTNADKLDVASASPMDISATSDGDAGDEDDIDNNDDIEDSMTEGATAAAAVPRRRTSIAAESIDLAKLRSSIKVVPKTEEESERIFQILQQNVLFRHMDDGQLKTVQGAMTLVEKKATDTIIQQGDDGDYFYIIDNGEVDVYLDSHEANTNDDDEQQQLVASYGEGDSFGELAIMYNAPRAASCIARTDVRLWALDRISFKIVAMQTACSRRDEHKGFLASVPILSSLSEYEVLTLADALEEQSFEDGAVICKEGDDGDRFFLIKDGHAVCSKENPTDGTPVVVAQLGKGDYFGEVALLTEKKRQATVQASGDLKCLSVDRMAFGRCIGPLESVLRRNLDQYSSLQELLDKGIV